jgi:hypothetical protein
MQEHIYKLSNTKQVWLDGASTVCQDVDPIERRTTLLGQLNLTLTTNDNFGTKMMIDPTLFLFCG